MWLVGSIIAFIISVVLTTIYGLQHYTDRNFDLVAVIVVSLILITIVSVLSWITVGAAVIIFITYSLYTKYQKGKQNEKQN